jgi:metal-responsive CopG/Arc/MetJ family transcriptional regulator
MERALVSLPDKVMARIDKLKGEMGEGRSDTIRTIVIAYLSEHGYLRGDEK